MSKKIVIFGGSGFIGSHVADFLTKRKYDVFIFDIKKVYIEIDFKNLYWEIH